MQAACQAGDLQGREWVELGEVVETHGEVAAVRLGRAFSEAGPTRVAPARLGCGGELLGTAGLVGSRRAQNSPVSDSGGVLPAGPPPRRRWLGVSCI